MRKGSIIVFILMLKLSIILLIGCGRNSFRSAEFTNTTPAVIKLDQSLYFLTDELLSSNDIEEQIGKINKVNAIVSYSEEDNPYKNPSKIYKLKNIRTEEEIAVRVNNKLYRAKVKPLISLEDSAEGAIKLNDVSTIEISHMTGKKITYTSDKNEKEIEEFLKAYNEAKAYDNSDGTTPNSDIIITLTNGKKMSVSGGSQGFQTVQMDEKQFNIKGDKLWEYFKQLNKQLETQ